MKHRIGVMTFYKYNYGGFLQAFALQHSLDKLGYDAELIQYDYFHDIKRHGGPGQLFRAPHKFFISFCLTKQLLFKRRRFYSVMQESVKRNLKESPLYINSDKLCSADLPYDLCISGSDQVFNPNIIPYALQTRLLDFSQMPTLTRIAYAASVGNKTITANAETQFARCLPKFAFVSARDQYSADFLQQYYPNKVEIYIDPTFLLSRDEWIRFSRKPNWIVTSFVFVHMIGIGDQETDAINSICSQFAIPVVNSDNRKLTNRQIFGRKPLSPEEFIWCIANASYVITNSFHGAAISMNLRKKALIVIPKVAPERVLELVRNSGGERLLSKTLIEDNEIDSVYSSVSTYIEKEVQRATDFLSSLDCYVN